MQEIRQVGSDKQGQPGPVKQCGAGSQEVEGDGQQGAAKQGLPEQGDREVQVMCTKCGTSFKPKEELWKHGYRVHVCTKCGNLFKPKERFWVHGDRVHGWYFTQPNKEQGSGGGCTNVGLHSIQMRSSGDMDTEFMMDVGP